MRTRHAAALLAVPLILGRVAAQQPLTLDDFPQSACYLMEARGKALSPKGHGLLVVLPGGPGTADFLPWVQNGIHSQAPSDFLCAMLTAPRWREDQEIVWPTAARKERGMKYTTEDQVRAVVAKIEQDHRIDPDRRIVLCWSSSGPAVYELLLSRDNPFGRAYVAMSVFPPVGKTALRRANGLRLLLDQSPDDQQTRFVHAENARDTLTGYGAVARLVRYRGGHGWHDDPKARIQEGLRWLLSDEPAPTDQAALPPAVGKNLLRNGGFDDGTAGWQVIDNSGRLQTEPDKQHKEGKASLRLHKTGGAPLDLLRQDVTLPKDSTRVTARVWVKSKGARNAWVKCFLYDADDQLVHESVDLLRIQGDADWQQVEQTWDRGASKYAVFQVVLVLGGEVWVDGAEVIAGK